MSTYPWVKSYPPGTQWDTPLTLERIERLLERARSQWPEKSALSFMGRTIPFAELGQLVDRMTVGLRALGVGPGVHVGLLLPNTPQYVISFFAILKAGGTVVNYSPLDAANTIAHKIEDSQTQVMITLDLASLCDKIPAPTGVHPLRHVVVGQVGEFSAHPDQVQAQLATAGQLSASPPRAGQVSFQHLLAHSGTVPSFPDSEAHQHIAVLQYTGGTTGFPKGAILTHANLSAATSQATHFTAMGGTLLQEGCERILVALPMFHVYAMVVTVLMGARIGAELVLVMKFDPQQILRDIVDKHITCFPGVPTMFTALVSQPNVADFDLRSLKACGSGGAPLPTELLRRFESLTGCILSEGWGMSETSALGTFTPTSGPRKTGSCGIPAPGVVIEFRDLNDPNRLSAPGEAGEIVIAGPNVMPDYWQKEAEHAEFFTDDGFLRTGDVGTMDEDGFLYIADRTKDMLLCGGFNVYPRLIEEAIYAHPLVQEVIVIGIDDPYRGQAPKAFLKLLNETAELTLHELQDFLKDRLGKHEMVHAMEVRIELPKTAVGKLSKRMLMDELAAATSQRRTP